FFQAEDGIRDFHVTGVQTCALPISTVSNKGIGKGVTAACSVTEVIDFCRFIGGFAPASDRKNPRILTYMTFFYQPRYSYVPCHEARKSIAHFLLKPPAIADMGTDGKFI